MKHNSLSSKIFVFLIDSMGMNVRAESLRNLSDKLIATDNQGSRYEITIAFLGNIDHNEISHAIKPNKLDFAQDFHKNG